MGSEDHDRELEHLHAKNAQNQYPEQLGLFFVKIGDRGYYVCEAVWQEIETLRKALKTVCLGVVSERESLDWFIMDGAALRVARDAIRESGDE